MGEWVETTWGNVIALQRGFDITRTNQVLTGSVPVVSSSGVGSFHNVAQVRGPGVIIGRKGSLGSVHYVAEDYWPHDTTLWVADFKGSNPRFVFYALQQLDTSHMNVGSASPTLNRNHVYPLPVAWPPPAEQDAIAEVLGALDDKVSANETGVRQARALLKARYHQSAANSEVELLPVMDAFRIEFGEAFKGEASRSPEWVARSSGFET